MNKNTYCPMPFVTLSINPGNYISRCMMSHERMGPIAHDTYSNKQFQDLRKNMLSGVWDKEGCRSCLHKEQQGMKSQRQKWLEREVKYLGEEGIYENNLDIRRNKIYHLYMNFSNICNFKCRMCGPWFSNAWLSDWKKMGTDDFVFIPPKQQIDLDKFLEEFGSDLSELRQIWITGGEPFIDDSVFSFFERLKDYCDISKITVTINTNASKLQVEKLKLLTDLKKLQINISVDATGEIYEYMRGYNYTFEELSQKIRDIRSLNQENLLITINSAFQIYNILDIEDYFSWGVDVLDDAEFGFCLEFRILTHHPRLQARHAPDYIKEISKNQILRLIEKYPEQQYLPELLIELEKPRDIEMVKSFIEWNSKLDKIRKTNTLPIVTEIYNYWKDKI